MRKKRTVNLASNHHTIRVAPPDVDRESLASSEPTPAGLVRAIECSFKTQLLKPETREEGVEVSAAGLRRIRLVVRRFGHTALVAGVLRGDEDLLESLTICRSGLDNAEDDEALTAAAELMVRDDDRPELLQRVECVMELVQEHPRPIAVHIHFDALSFDDPSVRIVSHCLAESFFDQFGLEKCHQATDL